MRRDAALADRNASVRRAARSWEKAGVIDETARKAVEAAVPDDRARVGPVFRVLLFLFTALAANALFGFLWLLFFDDAGSNEAVVGTVAIVYGLALVALTEFQIGRLKRSQGGTEAATSLVALGYLIGGFALLQLEASEAAAISRVSIAAAVLFAAAAWRWGYPLYAGAAAVALLVAVARLTSTRFLWIVLPVVLAPLLLRLADAERLPPAHRNSWKAVLVVSLIGLYVAVHYGSFQSSLVELIGNLGQGPLLVFRGDAHLYLLYLSAAATALVPIVLLAMAVRTRRRVFLLLGLGTAAASAITFCDYADLRPVWAVFTVAGIALSAAVLALRRYLDSGPGKERGGFTAEPLFEDLERQRLLEVGAAVATLSPEARTIREEPRFKGGGGEFGGGGSSTEF